MSDEVKRIKREIDEKVKEYYASKLAVQETFKPGKSTIKYAGRVFDEQEILNLVDAALEFWLTHGKYSRRFEEGMADFLGIKNCFLVNSGSSANLLAFTTLTAESLGERRIRRGDEVITVAAAFPTTVAPIVQYGAVPVFVDVDLKTANIDVSYLEEALSSRTKAVMLAHTLGNPFDLAAVVAFCQKHGLWLIEDNCDALGSRYRGQLTGTFGDIGTSSFYPPHHLTMGEGGAVYTNNDELARILLSLRDWGRDCTCPSGMDNTCGRRFDGQYGALPPGYDHKYVYSRFGYNLKATDLQAAIGCAQLTKLPNFIETRRRNWQTLRNSMEELKDWFILPEPTKQAEPSWFGFLLTVREDSGLQRNEIVRYLEKRGIQTRMLFGGNLLRQPCLANRETKKEEDYRIAGELRQTDRLMMDSFWLGVYPGLNEEQLEFMVNVLREFCRLKKGVIEGEN